MIFARSHMIAQQCGKECIIINYFGSQRQCSPCSSSIETFLLQCPQKDSRLRIHVDDRLSQDHERVCDDQ
jgi:hypothetical protein